ncbi:hypothetical protein EON79_09310 [bacterium]|nr:MAG: hypothetical protein EON79_09310 [bacterium]
MEHLDFFLYDVVLPGIGTMKTRTSFSAAGTVAASPLRVIAQVRARLVLDERPLSRPAAENMLAARDGWFAANRSQR